jgi:thymidylate synthase ThyX
MVQLHENIVGIDSAIFMHPKVWKASGHVDGFNDPMIDNKDSKKRYRADQLIEDKINQEKINIIEMIKKNFSFSRKKQNIAQKYIAKNSLKDLSNQTNRFLEYFATVRIFRANLNLIYYTQMYWKIDLHNLMHFLRLRADSHAQYEIRAYAERMLDILKLWLPHTYEAFENYSLNAIKISAQGKEIIKRMIAGEKVTQETSGFSKREWNELMKSLDLI